MFTPEKLGKMSNLTNIFIKLGWFNCHHPVSALDKPSFPGFPSRSGVFSDSASLDGEPARLGEAFGLVELTVPEMSNEKGAPGCLGYIGDDTTYTTHITQLYRDYMII